MDIKNKINNMDEAKREKLGEVIRFGIVGGLATVLQYGIYLAIMPVLSHFIPQMGDHTLATRQYHRLYREFHLQLHRQHPLYF